jgi:hypothetical protein
MCKAALQASGEQNLQIVRLFLLNFCKEFLQNVFDVSHPGFVSKCTTIFRRLTICLEQDPDYLNLLNKWLLKIFHLGFCPKSFILFTFMTRIKVAWIKFDTVHLFNDVLLHWRIPAEFQTNTPNSNKKRGHPLKSCAAQLLSDFARIFPLRTNKYCPKLKSNFGV